AARSPTMPRKPKQAAPPAAPAQPENTTAPNANGSTETVAGYFRRVFQENPRLLNERSNDALYARWLADHPGHAQVPDSVKANLQNRKSVLRKRKGKKAPRRPQAPAPAPVAAVPAAVQKERPRAAAGSLARLEGMIDECLFLARGLGADGLEK